MNASDVWGLNYELGEAEAARAASRLGCVLVTECANYPHSERGRPEEEWRQVQTLSRELASIEDGRRPWLAGYAMWCFSDYATMRKQRYLRYSGIVDAWRQPKMAAAFLRARYARQPVLSLHADWGETASWPDGGAFLGESANDAGGSGRPVVVFTNCDTLELRVGDVTVWQGQGANPLVLRIPHEAGDGMARRPGAPHALGARGVRAGESVEVRYAAWGSAERIELACEEVGGNCGGIVAITVRVVDGMGRTVRAWCGAVGVEADGDLDVHTYTRDDVVRVTGGTGRVYVTRRDPSGPCRLTARAPGLREGTLDV
jgi:hypothetical protein